MFREPASKDLPTQFFQGLEQQKFMLNQFSFEFVAVGRTEAPQSRKKQAWELRTLNIDTLQMACYKFPKDFKSFDLLSVTALSGSTYGLWVTRQKTEYLLLIIRTDVINRELAVVGQHQMGEQYLLSPGHTVISCAVKQMSYAPSSNRVDVTLEIEARFFNIWRMLIICSYVELGPGFSPTQARHFYFVSNNSGLHYTIIHPCLSQNVTARAQPHLLHFAHVPYEQDEQGQADRTISFCLAAMTHNPRILVQPVDPHIHLVRAQQTRLAVENPQGPVDQQDHDDRCPIVEVIRSVHVVEDSGAATVGLLLCTSINRASKLIRVGLHLGTRQCRLTSQAETDLGSVCSAVLARCQAGDYLFTVTCQEQIRCVHGHGQGQAEGEISEVLGHRIDDLTQDQSQLQCYTKGQRVKSCKHYLSLWAYPPAQPSPPKHGPINRVLLGSGGWRFRQLAVQHSGETGRLAAVVVGSDLRGLELGDKKVVYLRMLGRLLGQGDPQDPQQSRLVEAIAKEMLLLF